MINKRKSPRGTKLEHTKTTMSDLDDNDQQALYTGEDTGTTWHPGERTVTMKLELDYLLQKQTDNQLLSKPEEDTWTSWITTRIHILQAELIKEKERCDRKPMEQDQTSKDNTRDAMLLQGKKDEESLCQFWKMRQRQEPVPYPMSQGPSDLKRKLLSINQAMVENRPKMRKLDFLKTSLTKKNLRFVTHQSVHLGKSSFLTRKIGWKVKQRAVLIPQRSEDGQDEDAQD